MQNYFNTTKESGNQLELFVKKAKSQDKEVMRLMQKYSKASASQLIKYFKNVPITSIRRSLSTLSKKGKLVKTDDKVVGNYGRNEYVYAIVLVA